jgi:hypothetical protein
MSQETLPLASHEPKRIVEMESEDFVKLYEERGVVRARTGGWAWLIGGDADACPMCMLAACRVNQTDPIAGIREIIRRQRESGESYSMVVAKATGEHPSTILSFASGFDGNTPWNFAHDNDARKRENQAAYKLGQRTRVAMSPLLLNN